MNNFGVQEYPIIYQKRPKNNRTFRIIISIVAILLISLGILGLCLYLFLPIGPYCDKNEFKANGSNRIIDGDDAAPHSYPFIVSLHYKSALYGNLHICGGSILNDQWVLTAGHCIESFYDVRNEKYSVITGLHKLNEYSSSQVYIVQEVFTNFISSNILKDDWALLKLKTRIKFDDKVQPIELSQTPSENFIDKCLVTAGWGSTSKTFDPKVPNKLQETYLRVINDDSKCKINNEWEKNSTFCTKSPTSRPYTMTCSGDSGGPLFSFNKTDQKWYLEGITSYVVMKFQNSKRQCLPKYPGFFTKVYNYKRNILKTISDNS
ncbi:unnamed protein product [Brachionus calyciflorus]|uniref:Peptidase S1 domain-containing protein n=1 Tax=Brachionus calyciflorus TaxID=104777 RepID=A0A814NKA9_9BILA|nr:unnamed protein product [Brachionus calyciflorus]